MNTAVFHSKLVDQLEEVSHLQQSIEFSCVHNVFDDSCCMRHQICPFFGMLNVHAQYACIVPLPYTASALS
jgi:hypothetical protein